MEEITLKGSQYCVAIDENTNLPVINSYKNGSKKDLTNEIIGTNSETKELITDLINSVSDLLIKKEEAENKICTMRSLLKDAENLMYDLCDSVIDGPTGCDCCNLSNEGEECDFEKFKKEYKKFFEEEKE